MGKGLNESKQIFAVRLLEDFKNAISGKNVNRVTGKSPEKVFFVGKLSPESQENENVLSSKSNIYQIGMDFTLSKEEFKHAEVAISIGGDFYYRVFPTFKEQSKNFLREINNTLEKQFTSMEELFENREGVPVKFSQSILPVYEKVSLKSDEVLCTLKLAEIYDEEDHYGFIGEQHSANNTIRNKIVQLENYISEKPETYAIINEQINLEHLKEEATFFRFIRSHAQKKVNVNWTLRLLCEIKEYEEDSYRISISILNESMDSNISSSRKNNEIRINTFFNSKLKLKLNNANFKAIELNYFEDDYKYDRKQKAIGINCSIKENEDNILETTHLPIYVQKRLKTREDMSIKFVDLIENPIETLLKIYKEMGKELEGWNQKYEMEKAGLTGKGNKQFQEEIKAFDEERNRFKNGVELISNHQFIKDAFILMNKAFLNSPRNYGSWRLFQIVFIVSLLLDIAAAAKDDLIEHELQQSRLEEVDLLYFPTGGGKTEAFLGVVVFNLFFDRLRGKTTGTTAIVKYPLRLLSIQQFQRIANILAAAELVRRENDYVNVGEPFSLGYFVGDKNTPNKIEKVLAESLENMSQKQLNEDYKIVDICPFCQQNTLNIGYDAERNRLYHKCTNVGCTSNGELEVYMVDQEIYRYIPSVIVSTIDKQAAIGYQSGYSNILGQAIFKCPKHGYSNKTKCLVDNCNVDFSQYEKVDLKDAAPTLLIQDELHLVRESLGVYDAHYETFMQYYIKELSSSKRPMKVIGATATISAYEQQIYHLYLKGGIRFPCQSPYVDKNFYAFTDKKDIQRQIIGLAPFGQPILSGVVHSMQYMKRILGDYYKYPEKLLNIENIGIDTKEEAINILDDYWVMLEYNNVKSDGNRVINDLEGPINRELQVDGVQPFKIKKMTGDDTFQEVRKILELLETSDNIIEEFNTITATSMISHGVDADRFNQMFFFGVPGNTAEYIQAYSRAGRKYTGLIILLIRPTRERDKSYLKNFVKFNEFKDILVDPVPINRWASKAIEHTFPGILAGLLINYFNLKVQFLVSKGSLYMMDGLQRAVKENLINKEEVLEHLLKIYGCIGEDGTVNPLGNQYRDYIVGQTEDFFKKVVYENYSTRETNLYITDGLEALGFNKPMLSLRDTEDNVTIEVR